MPTDDKLKEVVSGHFIIDPTNKDIVVFENGKRFQFIHGADSMKNEVKQLSDSKSDYIKGFEHYGNESIGKSAIVKHDNKLFWDY